MSPPLVAFDVALIATIADARRAAGLSQRQLAQRLGRAHSFVGKLEKGRRHLVVREFCEVALAVGVDPPELLMKTLRNCAGAERSGG